MVWKSDWSNAAIMELESIIVGILKTLLSAVNQVHNMYVVSNIVFS